MLWRFRIAKMFSSNIQDGSHVGSLEALQTTSDSGLLKAISSDSQDGHHDTYHDKPNPGEQFWPIWASSLKKRITKAWTGDKSCYLSVSFICLNLYH